jgi:hypothetical protein
VTANPRETRHRRRGQVDRDDLTRFLFAPQGVVVAVGRDRPSGIAPHAPPPPDA